MITSSPLKYTIMFVLLILAQVLICNNILLFGVAFPFLFIFFILTLPLNTNLNLLMALSFLMGLLIDIFDDTLGLLAFASLLLAVIRKPVFYLYMHRDEKFAASVPCISVMGWAAYLKYIFTLTAFFTAVVFGIEFFNFEMIGRIFVMIISSTLLTMVLLTALDAVCNREPYRE